MSIETRFDIAFIAAMARREKQIQQNYRPIIAVHNQESTRSPAELTGNATQARDLERFTEGLARSTAP